MRDRRKKILLIEDNPADARLVKELLAEASTARFQLSHVKGMSQALES